MKNIFKIFAVAIVFMLLFIVGFKIYSKTYDMSVIYKQFNKEFGIDLSYNTKLIYFKEYISMDPAIEGVLQINYATYNKIMNLPLEGRCKIDRNIDFLKDKTDEDILRQMYSDEFLKMFPLSFKNFKYCLESKNSFSIWRVFKFNNKYYLTFAPKPKHFLSYILQYSDDVD